MKDGESLDGRAQGLRGVPVYIMGPSGSGKDSLIAYARRRLDGAVGIAFAHRYITRPPEAGGENHVPLSQREFIARARQGLFAMHWRSHGQLYGIGVEMDLWLRQGWAVVVNGSRTHYAWARRRYPGLLGILIDAAPAVLEARLAARGREAPHAVRARLARNEQLKDVDLEGALRLRNDGSLASSGEQLVRWITRSRDGRL